jgi:peroxiredoxin
VSRAPLILVTVALLSAAAGYGVSKWLHPAAAAARSPVAPVQPPRPEDLVGSRRPDFTLADRSGEPVSAAAFDGQVVLVNFWASWCAPCVREMPMLSELQSELGGQGLRVIGIAVDDPERARTFAEGLGLGYTLLFGLGDAMLTGRSFGNGTGQLPYSVLVDASGVIRWTHLGALDRDQVEARLREWL